MSQARLLILLAVVLNVAVLLWLLLRSPTDSAPPKDLGTALSPLLEDNTMAGARYDLGEKAARLNVILISMDALRYDRTGFGGNTAGLTPNLDQLAEESVVFHKTVSAASWTLPSHMSMWTARWPSVHRVTNKLALLGQDQMAETSLSPGIDTLPNQLIQAGRVGAAFTGGAGVSGRYGFNRGFETYVDDRAFAGMDYSAPKAIDWIRTHRDKPFFLFLHGYDSHGQYPLPESEIGQIPYEGTLKGDIEEQARLREQGLAAIRSPGDDASLTDALGPADGAFLKAIYDRKVRDADQRVGAFVAELRAMGILEDTLLVVVSDHGDEFMEHGSLDHGHTLYEEQLHTVFLLRIPGFTRRQDVRELARTVDLFPTVFDLLGLPVPTGVDGRSLLPMLRGEAAAQVGYAETDYRLFVHRRSMREGDLKLVLDLQDGERRLYDLAKDPLEQTDISSSEPRKTYEMEQALKRWMAGHGSNPQDYLGIRQEPIKIF